MNLFFSETDKMCQVISEEYHLLQLMSRFGISLGFGERTVREVCEEHGVDVATFLAVANFIKGGEHTAAYFIDKVSVRALISYLEQAHAYFLDFQLPEMRRKLLSAIAFDNDTTQVPILIMKFFDEFYGEVRNHMQSENRRTFPYVEALLEGRLSETYNISMYSRNHDAIDKRLQELKNIIIKYYKSGKDTQRLSSALFDIFNCESELHVHNAIEDYLFVPAVKLLEESVRTQTHSDTPAPDPERRDDTLSEREKEIVGCVVRGMSNKEIAEKLFISVNTVLTHRKNIARKLAIRSVSGLTIYAIVNGIVNIDEIDLK